jgi:hypothetical protein
MEIPEELVAVGYLKFRHRQYAAEITVVIITEGAPQMWDTIYCHNLILILIKFSRDWFIIVLWQILTAKAGTLD